jgi:hypothetical protein
VNGADLNIFQIEKAMSFSRQEYLNCLKRDIDQAKKTGLKLNATLITKGCCSECDKIDGKELTFEEVLSTNPLPYKNCIRENGCICCYGFKTMRDKDGRLIRKK